MAEDVIVALDDLEVTNDLEKRLKLYHPGETVRWHAFRHGRLVHGTMKFLKNPYPPMRLVALPDRTEAQKKSFRAWAGREFETKS
jgi:predicted metalloprotease with PDZ domain